MDFDVPFFGLLQGLAVIVLIILIYLALNRKKVSAKKSRRKIVKKNKK
jgi:multisubunit Na+/H+ antiporter MnhB subunit